MSDPVSPGRLGLWTDLIPRYAAAGWVDGDAVVPAAVPLLAAVRAGPELEATLERLAAVLADAPELARAALDDPDTGAALTAICGASRALSLSVQSNPAWLTTGAEPASPCAPEPVAVRRFVRRGLLRVAVRDLLGMADMPQVGRELSDLADAAADAALDHATTVTRQRPEFADLDAPIPFCVIAMGKWGGTELNYASDIDVLFVHDTPTGVTPDLATRYARRVAEAFMDALGGVTAEGIAYRVDADLRPEGRAGALARSLDSYRSYYDRWAQPWEFQALIKARPAVGDPELGTAFTNLTTPFVYPDTLGADTIRYIRTMKARIERERIPPDEDPAFHMKLGPGGMADVEFTAQLLQLAHGAGRAELRTTGTLAALAALAEAGVLAAAEVERLHDAYRFCGRVRNRLYLQAGRGRDSLPGDAEQATRLGLSLGYEVNPRTTLRETYRRLTRRARKVVNTRFYGLEA